MPVFCLVQMSGTTAVRTRRSLRFDRVEQIGTGYFQDSSAYYPIAVALLDAKLVCSASLPCPAEMSGSIHISGTGSSIIDTVFVCRSTGAVSRHTLADNAGALAELVFTDLDQLTLGDVKVTKGDARCVTFGHLTRLCVWNLRRAWKPEDPVSQKVERVEKWLSDFASADEVVSEVERSGFHFGGRQRLRTCETPISQYQAADEVPF